MVSLVPTNIIELLVRCDPYSYSKVCCTLHRCFLSAGNVAASKDLPVGEWKPRHPGYDFLDLIEKDKLRDKNEHDRLNIKPRGGEGAFLEDLDLDHEEEVPLTDSAPRSEPGES